MRRFETIAIASICALASSGCGESMTVPDEPDAATPDLATPIEDGGADPLDMVLPDPVDMFVPDPDAGPVICEDEGTTRAVVCGACGLRQETCLGGEWTATGECLGEGECAPGSVEMEDTPMCGSRARICSDECAWRDWTMTSDDGECVPGSGRSTTDGCPADQSKEQTCSATCVWEDDSVCEGDCGPLRTSPAHQEEVCVPAGDFIRGDDFFPNAPEATVTLSAFVADRYPVTNRRFRACRAAGACVGELVASYWETVMADDANLDHPVHMASYDQAVAFCAWDGGRRLLTEAEYEKAARGPYPRDNAFVWGDTYSCAMWPTPGDCTEPARPDAPVGTYAGLSGYYVDDITGGTRGAWVSDWYGHDYFSWSGSLVDPTGPVTGTARVQKAGGVNPDGVRISNRSGATPDMGGWTFRCARNP